MNARWAARIIGIFMLIAFFIVMLTLQKKLVQMRNSRPPATSTSTTGTR